MIVFELTMPNKGSWNNKWSGDGQRFLRCRSELGFSKETLKNIVNKDFTYSWNDGWVANVSVSKVTCAEERMLMKKSAGFCGYDWMINSIIKHGYIKASNE